MSSMPSPNFLEAIFENELILHPNDILYKFSPHGSALGQTHQEIEVSNEGQRELEIILPNSPSPEEDEKPLTLLPSHKGGYQKKILIILESAHPPLASAEELEFLGQIIKAINLSSVDVALLNSSEPFLTAWIEKHEPVLTLSFADVMQLEFSQLTPFQIVAFFQGNALLLPSLNSLRSSNELKKKVWASVKDLAF